MTYSVTEIGQTSILIVDDRKENLMALEGWLDEFDLDIVRATSGNEALAQMLEKEFALVLLDVQMPGMDGFETAELMRGTEKTRNVPIIFVTAINKEDRDIFKGYESGAVDYLFKPFNPHILRSKVAVFVELYRQKQMLQKTIADPNQALAEVKILNGLLPICACCKNVRDDKGYWSRIESYLKQHSEIAVSHSICPECAPKYYPDVNPYE